MTHTLASYLYRRGLAAGLAGLAVAAAAPQARAQTGNPPAGPATSVPPSDAEVLLNLFQKRGIISEQDVKEAHEALAARTNNFPPPPPSPWKILQCHQEHPTLRRRAIPRPVPVASTTPPERLPIPTTGNDTATRCGWECAAMSPMISIMACGWKPPPIRGLLGPPLAATARQDRLRLRTRAAAASIWARPTWAGTRLIGMK